MIKEPENLHEVGAYHDLSLASATTERKKALIENLKNSEETVIEHRTSLQTINQILKSRNN